MTHIRVVNKWIREVLKGKEGSIPHEEEKLVERVNLTLRSDMQEGKTTGCFPFGASGPTEADDEVVFSRRWLKGRLSGLTSRPGANRVRLRRRHTGEEKNEAYERAAEETSEGREETCRGERGSFGRGRTYKRERARSIEEQNAVEKKQDLYE